MLWCYFFFNTFIGHVVIEKPSFHVSKTQSIPNNLNIVTIIVMSICTSMNLGICLSGLITNPIYSTHVYRKS